MRIRTGRFLSGVLNVYQQTSPRFTERPNPAHSAKHRTRPARQRLRA
jgi:hypothetical protein